MKPALIPTVAAAALTLGQIVSSQTTTSPCADQSVFDQCKANQETYLKTCSPQDYACLCRWQTVKVSCWNSCPNDPERSTQASLEIIYCSQPGANVTSIWSSTAAAPTSAVSASANPSAGTSTVLTTATGAGNVLSAKSALAFTSLVAMSLYLFQ